MPKESQIWIKFESNLEIPTTFVHYRYKNYTSDYQIYNGVLLCFPINFAHFMMKVYCQRMQFFIHYQTYTTTNEMREKGQVCR